MKYHDLRACGPKCRSREHANELTGLLSRTSDESVLLSGMWQCCQCHKVQDAVGRYLLHVAAMYGRRRVCEWLVRLRRADVNVRTQENGWTPAHCALFYGHIDVLVALVRLGANLAKNDSDRLTPVEGLALDRWMSTRHELDPFGTTLIISKHSKLDHSLIFITRLVYVLY